MERDSARKLANINSGERAQAGIKPTEKSKCSNGVRREKPVPRLQNVLVFSEGKLEGERKL